MSKKPKYSTGGGGIGYHQVRSKIAKLPNGDGQPVSVEREKMMQKLGYDPGYNVVAMHKDGGSHKDPNGDPFTIGTRSENTADSNKARAKKIKRKIMGYKSTP